MLGDTLDFSLGSASTTFRTNQISPVHRWYSYVEGFSGNFVKEILTSIQRRHPLKLVLDPFCGSGTTLVEACFKGIPSVGYDINPFLVFVSSIKTSMPIKSNTLSHRIEYVRERCNLFKNDPDLSSLPNISSLFSNENVFPSRVLKKLFFLKKSIDKIKEDEIRNLLTLAVSSIIVEVSHYRRGPDLALKRHKHSDAPVFERFFEKSLQILNDINYISREETGTAKVFCGDSRNLSNILDETVDLVITSPPYLNGTNYFRNTKLELWFNGMLNVQSQLHSYRMNAITAGICDVFKSKSRVSQLEEIREKVEVIKKNAYDMRIPLMVSTYFEDIFLCLKSLFRKIKEGGRVYWVVGDSAFAKIHVPTDKFTVDIAKRTGFSHIRTSQVRVRKSRSGLSLREVVIELTK